MKKNTHKSLFAISLCLILLNVSTSSAKTTRYVTINGTGDGSSWANASNSIQAMIDNSAAGDDVWVAKGTYYPTTETIARDSRSRSFVVKSGVNLYGGFTGSETDISQRALADLNADGKTDSYEFTNQTILSGDIDGVADIWTKTTNTDGTWSWSITNNENNCYIVVTCLDINIIDGFYITGGNANHKTINTGGGIYNPYSVSHCTVSNCYASIGGGIYLCTQKLSTSTTNATDCMIFNCAASSSGGGICSSSTYNYISNCTVSNCAASSSYGSGGGIYSSASTTNCTISNCSSKNGGGIFTTAGVTKCMVSSCAASSSGGGIYSSNTGVSISYCTVSNCAAVSGGGIYTRCSLKNCTVTNCAASSSGGGIYSSQIFITNCAVFNCVASVYGGGIYTDSFSTVNKCAWSNNNSSGTYSDIYSGKVTECIYPNISIVYIQPTNFIGVATNDAQKLELTKADWHLKKGSPCINAGTNKNMVLDGTDLDNNPRVAHGTIDIGPYEYSVPKIKMPVAENFNDITDWNSSNTFYNSAQLNGGQNIKWNITNQKAQFSWQVNLTSAYTEPFFTYQVDASNTAKVYLRYDMYFQAYAGSITPLGTEKLNIEYSTDLVTWSTIATYSNANGTIANQTYKHDLSTQLAGKIFFIRFNANGANSNRIEKWEIDNIVIDADGLSAVSTISCDKYKYSLSNDILTISELPTLSTVTVYNIEGKKITMLKSNSGKVSVKLPHKGIYIISVNIDGILYNNKIIL